MRRQLLVTGLVGAAVLGGCAAERTLPATPAPSTVPVPPERSLAPPDPATTVGEAGIGTASPGADAGDRPQQPAGTKPQNPAGVERTARAESAAGRSRDRVACPAEGHTVLDADGLRQALARARPGTVIWLEPGSYRGAFVASTSGTADDPIWLCGDATAVLEGAGVEDGYVVHLDRADHWRLVGFTIRNGQKGLVADGVTGSVIQDLTVDTIGDEGIHLRGTSTDNRVIGNTIGNTGLRRKKFGEGIYVGSAVSNWCTVSACLPDRSDRNVIADNVIGPTSAEAVDIKEGTVGGWLVGNRFDGRGTVGADSWVDVKGTAWLIEDNTGVNAPGDGYQTHQILDRWGQRNLFRGNRATAGNAPAEDRARTKERYGFAFRPAGGNVLACDNVTTGSPLRPATVPCTRIR